MTDLRVMFMGTPSFALPALQVLHTEKYQIVGVITQPDRPQGRGQVTNPPAVKILAQKFGLPVYQPNSIKEQVFFELAKELNPEIIIVAAFGQILPKLILDIPRLGCLNIHPSLLPKYRGAAPINWTLIKGETKTGVTIMMMDEGMDSGAILEQEETFVDPSENYGHLHDRLARHGATLLMKVIEQILSGTPQPRPQDSSLATFAPRITKEMGEINWHNSVIEICNLIRGLSPSPTAYSFIEGKLLKIYAAEPKPEITDKLPGSFGDSLADGIAITAADGYVILKEVQLAGKKRMSANEFLRGYKLNPSNILGKK
ncbi:MAG: methionyl-tRNA formyltransferase [Syntrophaceae bacterium]|nr:methionyl-tRNA formyltransferase [Syntrophaceae bacterium]